MSQSSLSAWTWDPTRQDYYYATIDASGNYIYHFQKDQPPAASPQPSAHTHNADPRSRTDSLITLTAPGLPTAVKSDPDFIPGTPERGSRETLDSSYRMRSGAEIYTFFRLGKVFSMLHVQAASENDLTRINDNITVIKYGERAFSQIRRFVIVDVRRGFVYACPIFTYTRRGTLKSGCIPSEHSVVYLNGSAPVTFTGETERGLNKQPICVNPVDASVRMEPASRLHYAKAYPIETNVKVKDIGDVAAEHLSVLLRYYREENSPLDYPSYDAQLAQAPTVPTAPAGNYTHLPQTSTHQAQPYSTPTYSVTSYQTQPHYQNQPYQGQNYQDSYYYRQ
ncbi:hypothetical protein P171DRAFT_476883 [Karstenula rhodostoma CBS 690.94]|uniref:DUF6590 domain-containing protein n=1 Tax=Karstenula rhodostoma CBS 690.94 TaxID=1392251 RepID=A0A9P4P8Z2_9PLEO|nr:hypothetical protein P171DRAFT_476883 [Karstenula rhodostoma CBS 690.94]